MTAAYVSRYRYAYALQNITALPHSLADMCNSIALNGSVCQGFTYDSTTKLAVFKGQTPQQTVDISAEAKPVDNVTLWWLSAGEHLAQQCNQCSLNPRKA